MNTYNFIFFQHVKMRFKCQDLLITACNLQAHHFLILNGHPSLMDFPMHQVLLYPMNQSMDDVKHPLP